MARRRLNTQTAHDRQRLVKDFERRAQQASSVQLRRMVNSVAVVIHPTADETELLRTIGSDPSRCQSVDAYWRYGDSVYWVEVHGSCFDDYPAGLYYRFDPGHRQDVLRAVLPQPLVHSWDLEDVFTLSESLIANGAVRVARAAFQGTAIRLAGLRSPGEGVAEAGAAGPAQPGAVA